MKDTEDIIITKKYHELSASEKEAVKTYAENENDYNRIRQFLLATRQSFHQQKITPSEQLKEAVFAELHKSPSQKNTWLNSILVFLFPPHKKVYQYPSFQMALASLLFLLIFNYLKVDLKENQMAVQQEQKEINLPSPSIKLPEDAGHIKDTGSFKTKFKDEKTSLTITDEFVNEDKNVKNLDIELMDEIDEEEFEESEKSLNTGVVKDKDLNIQSNKGVKAESAIAPNEDEIITTTMETDFMSNQPARAYKKSAETKRSATQMKKEQKKVSALSLSETPELESLFYEVK